MKNIVERAIKTAVEAFLGVLIPELVIILQNGFPESWSVFWAALVPVLSTALATAISVTWNAIENKKFQKEEQENERD